MVTEHQSRCSILGGGVRGSFIMDYGRQIKDLEILQLELKFVANPGPTRMRMSKKA